MTNERIVRKELFSQPLQTRSFCLLLILIVRCLNFNATRRNKRPRSDSTYCIDMDVLMNYANGEEEEPSGNNGASEGKENRQTPSTR